MGTADGYDSLQSATLTLTVIDRKPRTRSEGAHKKETDTIDVTFGTEIGRGSTCVVYDAYYQRKNTTETVKCVVKEWYPQDIGVSRVVENGTVYFKTPENARRDFKTREKQFNDSIDNYYFAASIDKIKDTIPELKFVGSNGQGLYQVFEYNIGQSLDKIEWEKETHNGFLTLLECLTRSLGHWHDHNVMILDLSPGNIFWTKEHNLIRFIDFDSLVVRLGDKWQTRAQQKIRYNRDYLPPNLCQILKENTSFTVTEQMFISRVNEGVNYYFIGSFLYRTLFGKKPPADGSPEAALKYDIEKLMDKYPIVFQAEEGENVKDLLERVILRLLKSSSGGGYLKSEDIISDLKKLSKHIDNCFAEREKQRCDILAADILERFPAYKYCSYINGKQYHGDNSIGGYYSEDKQFIISDNVKRRIDILIVGSHHFRISLLKYILSCLQMENTEINIHLAAYNIWKEWRILTGKESPKDEEEDILLSESWPLLDRCVTWHDSRGIHFCSSRDVVYDPLAAVYLYTHEDPKKIQNIVKDQNIRYVFLLGNEKNSSEIIKNLKNDQHRIFIGYLTENADLKNYQGVEVISKRASYKRLNEELQSRHVYEKGFLVHKEYELGVDPGADRELIRKRYDDNKYNQLNSIRAALHASYKLASCGIDPEDENAAWKYFEKVLAQRHRDGYSDLFDRQVALEHKSWTGYQVVTGGVRPNDVYELDRYAFKQGNLWQDKTDKKHKTHPCISVSGPKRTLSNEKIWNRFDEECDGKIDRVESLLDKYAAAYGLDELDKSSLRLYYVIEKRKKENRNRIDQLFEELARGSQNENDLEIYLSISALADIWDQLKANVPSASAKWKHVWNELTYIIENNTDYLKPDMWAKGSLAELGTKVAPYIALSYRHDFKKSDEDLIESLPRLFIRTRNTENGEVGEFSVLRKLSGSMYRNLNAALMTEPNKLFLLIDDNLDSDTEKEIRERYRSFLAKRHIETDVRTIRHNDYQGISGHVYVDMTDMNHGTLSDIQIALSDKAELRAVIYWPGNKDYVGILEDQSIKMLQRPVYLSVEDSLDLYCVADETEPVTKQHVLTSSECIRLWKLYRSGLYEKMSKTVKEFDRKKRQWKIVTGLRKNPQTHQKKLPKHFLDSTGLRRVLSDLETKRYLEKVGVTSVDNVEILAISTCYPKLYKQLDDIMDYALRTGYEESAHSFSVCTDVSGKSVIKDVGSFMCYKDAVSKKSGLTGVFDENDKKYLLRRYGNAVYYNSIAVHEALTDMSFLFKSILYSECRREKVFDDLVMDRILTDKKLKADLVGVREGRIYLILIRDEPETETAVYYQYKEIVKNSLGRVIYILTRDVGIDIADDEVSYIRPQDMDKICVDSIEGGMLSGARMLCVAEKMRSIVNAGD